MPLVILEEREYTDPLTNEVLTGLIPVNLVAHQIAAENTIYVLRPIVDTITATFKVQNAWTHFQLNPHKPEGAPITLQAYLGQLFNRVHEIHDHKKWPTMFKRVKRYGNGYRYNLGLHAPKKDALPVLNFKRSPPKKGSTFRMEFSSDALEFGVPDILQERWAKLDGGFIPFPALMESAQISRIDLAIDVINLPLSEIIPYHPHAQTVWTAQTFLGAIETVLVYTGKKKKSHQSYKKRANLKMYDKKNEQKIKMEDPVYGDLPHTRIEFGHVQGPLFRNLHNWLPKDPPNWRFFRQPHFNSNKALTYAQLLDSMRVRGVHQVSEMFPIALSGIEALEKQFHEDVIPPEIYAQFHGALRAGALRKLIEWASMPMEQAFSLPKN